LQQHLPVHDIVIYNGRLMWMLFIHQVTLQNPDCIRSSFRINCISRSFYLA